jgi:hypothetical protein
LGCVGFVRIEELFEILLEGCGSLAGHKNLITELTLTLNNVTNVQVQQVMTVIVNNLITLTPI